jgi:UDP-3-O-[3-hydroxymyristoyl] glucosamine N-acyltransferase
MKIRLDEICGLIEAEILSEPDMVFNGIASIEDAGPTDLTFVSNPRYFKFLQTTSAKAVIMPKGTEHPQHLIPLYVDDPYFSFLKVISLFNGRKSSDIAQGISENAFIDKSAVIGGNVSIGAFTVIGEGVEVGDNTVIGPCSVIMKNAHIGKDCKLYPNVTIMDGCSVGDRVIIHAGAVIGADGFGFAPHEGKLHKIPQIGVVKIGSDVEIGACTCVDRAVFGVTVIGDGAKIDNLVQIAHNVKIGPVTVIASQAGISGSTTVGAGVKIGGQAGFAGHIHIGNFSSVGAQAGVTKDVPENETVSGYPAKNHMKAMRLEAALRGLPELIKKVREQELRIIKLERQLKEKDNSDV